MNTTLKLATLADYPTIQNMARFYHYDMSRYCGHDSADWAIPTDGLYESFDFKSYFEDPTRQAFIVRVDDELAGFALLNNIGKLPTTNWNMGEFFILARFQGTGIGRRVAHQIWNEHPGTWEVSVIPENVSALTFWRKVVSEFTNGKYFEEIKTIDYEQGQKQRYILSFDTTTLR